MTKEISTLVCLLSLTSCTAWIDDYRIDSEYQNGTSDTGTSTAWSDTDDDTDPPVSCGIMVTPPVGSDIEFCKSEGTSYSMGCDEGASTDTCLENELPRHRVDLSPFHIQRYETTFKQFEAFVSDHPEWEKGGTAAREHCNSSYLSSWPEQGPGAAMDPQPVHWVCWHAALAFCKWLATGMSLPSEAEWESAARAGPAGDGGHTYRVYPFGNTANCTIANYEGCEGAPLRVGQTTGRSPLGLFDMGGNVWEWVRDWHRDDYYCDPEGNGEYSPGSCNETYNWTDPGGADSGTKKGVRGGTWYHPMEMMRAAQRTAFAPEMSSNLIGFRCAR